MVLSGVGPLLRYTAQNNKLWSIIFVCIVRYFHGRAPKGRRWSWGLALHRLFIHTYKYNCFFLQSIRIKQYERSGEKIKKVSHPSPHLFTLMNQESVCPKSLLQIFLKIIHNPPHPTSLKFPDNATSYIRIRNRQFTESGVLLNTYGGSWGSTPLHWLYINFYFFCDLFVLYSTQDQVKMSRKLENKPSKAPTNLHRWTRGVFIARASYIFFWNLSSTLPPSPASLKFPKKAAGYIHIYITDNLRNPMPYRIPKNSVKKCQKRAGK